MKKILLIIIISVAVIAGGTFILVSLIGNQTPEAVNETIDSDTDSDSNGLIEIEQDIDSEELIIESPPVDTAIDTPTTATDDQVNDDQIIDEQIIDEQVTEDPVIDDSEDITSDSVFNELLSNDELTESGTAFYEIHRNSFFKQSVEDWAHALLNMTIEEIRMIAGPELSFSEIVNNQDFYDFNGFHIIINRDANYPNIISLAQPGLIYKNYLIGSHYQDEREFPEGYIYYDEDIVNSADEFKQYDYLKYDSNYDSINKSEQFWFLVDEHMGYNAGLDGLLTSVWLTIEDEAYMYRDPSEVTNPWLPENLGFAQDGYSGTLLTVLKYTSIDEIENYLGPLENDLQDDNTNYMRNDSVEVYIDDNESGYFISSISYTGSEDIYGVYIGDSLDMVLFKHPNYDDYMENDNLNEPYLTLTYGLLDHQYIIYFEKYDGSNWEVTSLELKEYDY